ncbi:MAG TPA: hypothetical protein ENJ45_01885 [Phaeodactylibacter sp.]|nr:hypothetical protein [Phaeodactylibacter sp.]
MPSQSLPDHSFKNKLSFWTHVLLVLLAWVGPFLIWWPLMVAGYLIIQLQFIVLNMCLLNGAHGLEESEDATFYSHLFELWGFRPNRKKLKFIIRRGLYIALAIFTVFWQVYLGHEHLLKW